MIYHVYSGFYYNRNTYIKACYYIEYIVMKKKYMNVITIGHVNDDFIKKLIKKLKPVKKQIAYIYVVKKKWMSYISTILL